MNFLALLGWSLDDKTEILSREELIKVFTLDRIGIASGIYDRDKLLWMNGVYIRKLSLDELVVRALPYIERPEAEGGLPASVQRPIVIDYTKRVLALEHERLKTLGEAAWVVSFFYEREISYDLDILIQKKMDVASTRAALVATRELLATLEPWEHTALEPPMRELAVQLNLKTGQLFGTIRTAVSGRTATPPLFQMMEVLGRDVCFKRIDQAIALLDAQ